MRVFFYLGLAFLVLAFAAAAAETIPRTFPEDYGFFISAHDLWYAAWPGSLVVAQIQVERLSPALWDPVLAGLLALPAWFLFALPGVLLIWYCRPHKEMSPAEREDLKKQEESFLLYEQLAREAREAGYTEGDDQAPDHEGHDLIDSEGGLNPLPEDIELGDQDFDGTGGGEEGNGSEESEEGNGGEDPER